MTIKPFGDEMVYLSRVTHSSYTRIRFTERLKEIFNCTGRKNLPPEDAKGWTSVLLERASRFIWELRCGRKDRKLFKRAIRTLVKVINTTGDLALITDGERRYGQVLFNLCSELVRTGKRGRPPRTLPKGIQVRVKNTGSRAPKRGRKRPKYQAPCREHPQTSSAIENTPIQANHLEAFNASLRRRCAAYRRKTNTYAKKKKRLQQRLDVYWILHNFARVHFTTKYVPAVALGIIEQGLSLAEIFSIPCVWN